MGAARDESIAIATRVRFNAITPGEQTERKMEVGGNYFEPYAANGKKDSVESHEK